MKGNDSDQWEPDELALQDALRDPYREETAEEETEENSPGPPQSQVCC